MPKKHKEEFPKRESRAVEFKESIDLGQAGDWCEIVKDIVAIANSGGGVIYFGLRNDASPSGWDPAQVLSLDAAVIVDKVSKYTGEQYADFEIREQKVKGKRIAAMTLNGVPAPMVFSQPGTYEVSPGKQKTAFGRGTVYVRHGSKSESASSKDLRGFVEREVEKIRRSWLGNIRKVVSAPTNYRVSVLPPDVRETGDAGATPIRIVDDPKAPGYRRIDPDSTHPHRQKEVMEEVNTRLGGKKKINTFDLLCVKRVHSVEKQGAFFYKSRFGSPQYSGAFVDWLVEQYRQDAQFFEKGREAYRKK